MSGIVVRATDATGARVITLDHPATRNSLSVADFHALADALRRSGSPESVVLRSAAPGAFCSGLRLDDDGRRALASGAAADAHAELMRTIAGLAVPVVAEIDGPAVGMGCELALRCDRRVGTPRAVFEIPAARLGLTYPAASVAALEHAVGTDAVAALLEGHRFDAEEALVAGLLHEVVPDHGSER